jgi:FHS family Na+ dependent glucose MFS transporter 1
MNSVSQQNPPGLPGKKTQTAGYYSAFIALGMIAAILGPTLPRLAEHTHVLLSQISYVFTARSIGYLLGSLFGGRLYDRRPGNPVMAVHLILIIGTLIISPILPKLWMLIVVMMLLGIGEGGLDVGGNTMLMWLHREKVGPYMNALHLAFGIGTFLSPVIIAQLVLMTGDINWSFWAMGLMMVPIVVWLFRLRSPENLPASAENMGYKTNYRLLALVIAFFAVYVGAEVSFGSWVFTYAVKLNLMNETVAAYLTSTFWGSFTFGRILSIPIAARTKPSAIMGVSLIGSLLSVSLILLWPGSIPVLWIGTFGTGLFMAALFPTMLVLAERRMRITGQVASLFFVGSSLGAMFLPWSIGQLFERTGPQITIQVVFIATALSVLIFGIIQVYFSRVPVRS